MIQNDVPIPINISFTKWGKLLMASFPSEDIPVPVSENNWRTWASILINLKSFENAPVPLKVQYPTDKSWRKWAELFIQSLNS